MEQTLTQSKAGQHIVWLDVARLVAMFTVVCCHSADPFNFFPGTSPDIESIKFWGSRLWRGASPLRTAIRNDYRRVAVAGTWRSIRIL